MDQLQRVMTVVEEAIGPKLLGAYLHGSSVHGGLKPASDLDVLVVTRQTLDDRERRALVDGILPISGPRVGSRPVELTVVVQSDLRPWRFPAIGDFLYGDWLRETIAAQGPPQREPMTNLALEIAMVLRGNNVLSGPPPADLLDPVPAAELARAAVAGIPSLLDDLDDDTRNVVLTLARIWATVATGEIWSKSAAADWALGRLAPERRPVLEHAKRLYLTTSYRDETWSATLRAQVRPHVDAVLAEIDELVER